jgi:dsDNA-specific endonuclease/ATPase MutS2
VVREEGDEKDGPSVRKPLSREAKIAYAEIQKGVSQLKRSAAEIHRSLRKAEQRIAADARARLRDLRKEARTQLAVVQSTRQEAARTLKSLSTAAGDSW